MAKVFYDVIGDRENVYNAANEWKENCLLQDRSLFNENHELWTVNNLQTLKTRFNENPMYTGKSTFDKKFEMQLQGATKDIYQLAMEIIYVYYLFPYSGTVSYRTKLLKLKDIASWGEVSYDNNHPLLKDLELGIGATGTYYNTAKFEEISYIIQFAITIKLMSIEERHAVLNDPWELKKVIANTKKIIGKNVQVQHIISHLIAPDYFECMASAGHKSLIVKNFNDRIQSENEKDIDKQLYEIRHSLETQGRYIPVNFYHNKELYEMWKPSPIKIDNSGSEIIKDTKSTYNISNVKNISTLGNLVFENEGILLAQIQTALNSGKHIILTGPPGTGKSKLANEICNQIGVSNKLVTATSNWTTYDTIGGYKPNKNGELYFDAGLFLQCFKNKEEANLNEWLIIDEINRADIDKAFGPLFSVLTGDEVTLPYEMKAGTQIILKPESKVKGDIQINEFVVPNDWRIIGTMNTIDKSSLFEMSYAFMRRFAFIPVGVPKSISPRLVEEYLSVWSIQDYIHLETLTSLWELINQYRKIGPAIVKDIANYTAESEDFTSAIILYVLPQFEGLSDYKIKDFVTQLCVKIGEVIAEDLLKDFIEDFFQIGVIDEI
ncbi:5-methylcytosine-specific restriction enzyme B [Peribacillus sp. Bi96]|uniref:AAA family ATPase n=1 Tax=Peribacillus sp. Bi96 TaxID=2884273 RepID=UPI001D73F3C6|nr:AAA family ATPase [Peribacillus sp. Bi96]CAH0307397.1 5-methylcytosine-specific restriction enzyme B [Peribacillus sp. Bi96]